MYISLKEEEKLKKNLHLKYKGIKKILLNKKLKQLNNFIITSNRNYIDNIKMNSIDGIILDDIQRKVIFSEEENTLVLAGAGSGKSLTILARIVYLVNNGVLPEDILVLSFTNASSDSLTKKLKQLGIDLKVLTFHKLGIKILKNKGYKFSIINDNILDNMVNNSIDLNSVKGIIDIEFAGDDTENFIKDNMFKNSDYFFYLKQTIITFINLFKSKNYSPNMFNSFYNKNSYEKNKYIRKRNKKYLDLIKDIYDKYENYLVSNNKIDFNDMINKAIDNVDLSYKYVIVDEYQDTSFSKFCLLKKIKENTNAKVMVVGDDWQSIYRFTGTDLSVFTEFEKHFKYTKVFKLSNTYRNSNELLRITSKFIMKNKNQYSKNLVSNKYLKNPIYIVYYDNQTKKLTDVLKKINKPYFILGRNNNDIKIVPKKYQKNFMTIHKSKGLEIDISVIINLEDSPLGFPNKIINDSILKYVSVHDTFPYEEERRLFYVALTRTKSYNILLVNKKKPSMFVKEIIKYMKN